MNNALSFPRINYYHNYIDYEIIPDIIMFELMKHAFSISVSDPCKLDLTDDSINSDESIVVHPFSLQYVVDEYEYCMLEKYSDKMNNKICNGELIDKEGNQITRESIEPYLKKYAIGFNEAYFSYQKALESHNSIFNLSSKEMAYKIFLRACGKNIKNGNFLDMIPISKIRFYEEKAYPISEHRLIVSSEIYKKGLETGEFYKAWEIILNNPNLFESIFEENLNCLVVKDKARSKHKNIIEDKDEKKIWFQVGLLFANGAMDELIIKFDRNASKIAEHLNNSSYNKYILATMNNYTQSNKDKNIYYNKNKVSKIIKYCKINNIKVTEKFIKQSTLS
jgi:hypothetical protein